MSRLQSKAPLRQILIVPFVIQIGLAVGLTGWLSIRNGQKAINNVVEDLWDEVTARTVQHLTEYMSSPKDLIADTLAQEELNLVDLSDQDTLTRYLWHQLRMHEGLFITAVGRETGEVAGVGVEKDGQVVIRAIDEGQTQLHTYEALDQGNRGALIKVEDFNLKTRPWYQEAVNAGQLIWTDIYPNYAQPFNIISAASPIYDVENNRLIGATNATLSLWQISQFLEEIEVGNSGEIFIIERSGDFVASSTGEVLYELQNEGGKEKRQRLNVLDSSNVQVRETARHLIKNFGNLNQIRQVENTEFLLDGEREFVQVTPFSDEFGLDWLIVMAVPASDFTEQMQASIRTTILLCLGALAVAIGSGIITTRWITKPLLKLNHTAKEIAQGDGRQGRNLQDDIAIHPIREIGELADSLGHMTQRLQSSLRQMQVLNDALAESQQRYQDLVENSPDIIERFDLQLRHLYVSQALTRLTGIAPESFLGKTCRELSMDETMVNAWETAAAELLRTGKKQVIEFSTPTLIGDRTFEMAIAPEWSDQQTIESILCISRDITERKQAAIQLQDLSDRLRLAFQSADMGIWDWDIVNNHLFWDDRMYELYGIRAADFSGAYDAWEAMIHPDDVLTARRLGQQALAGEIEYQSEFRVVWPDGSIHYLEAHALVQRDAEGHPLRMIGLNLDITERKQAEESRVQAETLRLELNLLETILDTVLAGYWDWDIPNHQTYMSPGLKQMLGYADHELPNVPESWQNLIFADDLRLVLDCFDRHVQSHGKEPYYNEVRYRHKNGSTIWVICAGQVIDWDASGQPLRMIGCHVDITQLKQAEIQLQKSDTHLKLAQRIGKLGSWEFDVSTQKVTWSDEVFRIFGRDRALGTPSFEELQQQIQPEARDLHRHIVEQAIATAQPYEIEYQVHRPNGDVVNIEAKGEPILDAAGHVIQLVGTILDITERKQVEATLRQSEATNRALISAIPDLLIWIDQKGTYLDVLGNSQSLKLCKALSEQVGKNIADILPEAHAKERMHYVRQALETHTLQVYEYQLEINGDVRDEEARIVVCGKNQVLCMVRDITERKRAEEKLRQTTIQLEASNRELEAFAYSVSHDLRSPLRAIDGFSKALLEDYFDQVNEEGKDYFDRIRYNIRRMGMLIDDLLSLSRISRSEMRYTKVNLSEIVHDHTQELRDSAPERQVEVVIAPDVIGFADPTLMRVALSNLLENAWKFTSHHSTARIEFGIIEQDKKTIYFIRDDGAGFDMAYSSMLFGVFQRLHNTDEFPGTGVGLATVQRAIHRHGGQVWAEAAVEQGATIYFTLSASSIRSNA